MSSDLILADDLVKILREQVDHEIICEMLKDWGWYTVIASVNFNLEDELEDWLIDNIKHKYRGSIKHTRWMFENEQDATWFTLRWSYSNE